MTVFADTSALYALLDRDDRFHSAARATFADLAGEDLVTHNYVLVEMIALTHRRLGAEAVRRFSQDFLPVLSTVWIDEATHVSGLAALLAALPTDVSLVDFVSFQVMRERGIARAFAFDEDFLKAGYSTLPS
jgi:predicted nucleic acid-binding protein